MNGTLGKSDRAVCRSLIFAFSLSIPTLLLGVKSSEALGQNHVWKKEQLSTANLTLAVELPDSTDNSSSSNSTPQTVSNTTISMSEMQIVELSGEQLAEHWETIAAQLPPLVEMRFPTEILLLTEEVSGDTEHQLEVVNTPVPDGLTTSIFTCESVTSDCFLGHFSAIAETSEIAAEAYLLHQENGNAITFNAGLTAYVLEQVGYDLFSPLASVMWLQDDQFYRVQFPIAARQAMLYTAKSMVDGPVIASAHANLSSTAVDLEQTEESFSGQDYSSDGNPIESSDVMALNNEVCGEDPILASGDVEAELQSESGSDSVLVRGVKVIGSTVFDDNTDFRSLFEEEGIEYEFIEEPTQKVTRIELTNLANAVTQLYVDRGYITSRVLHPPETLDDKVSEDGVFELQIIEGQLDRDGIVIDGENNVRESYIRNRLLLGVTTPLRIDRLEEQLRLLQNDSNFSAIEASLKPAGRGCSSLHVIVREAPRIVVGASIDNYSPPRVGSERLGIRLGVRNIVRSGDYLSGSYYRTTTGGSNAFDFRYTLPVNPRNGTIEFRVAPQENEVTLADFKALGLRGEGERYGVQFRQPIIRSLNEELALSLGFEFQEGQTFAFEQEPVPFSIGPDEDGVSRTSVISFDQSYRTFDASGAWALQSKFNFGTGLFDATSNADSIPDGYFFSWLFQGQRRQRLSARHLLVVETDFQLTPNALLPAQQFTIGGGRSVRGFPQNVRSGDNGLRLTVEDRITISRQPSGVKVKIAPFVDFGYVWNTDGNPNIVNDQNFLAGIGVGGIFEQPFGLEGLSIRIDYALPLIDLDDRGSNLQESSLYFRANYQSD